MRGNESLQRRRCAICKLTYYVATTVDGFIAHTDGSIDGFIGPETDFEGSLQDFDVVSMGRKTYELARRLG